MFVRIQKPTFSIYANTNVIQGLVKPCVPFLNKTKQIMKPTSVSITRENFRFFKPLCTRGLLVTQSTNLDIEKNVEYIFTSNKLLVIHKWSRKYTNKDSIIEHVLDMSNDVGSSFTFVLFAPISYRVSRKTALKGPGFPFTRNYPFLKWL